MSGPDTPPASWCILVGGGHDSASHLPQHSTTAVSHQNTNNNAAHRPNTSFGPAARSLPRPSPVLMLPQYDARLRGVSCIDPSCMSLLWLQTQKWPCLTDFSPSLDVRNTLCGPRHVGKQDTRRRPPEWATHSFKIARLLTAERPVANRSSLRPFARLRCAKDVGGFFSSHPAKRTALFSAAHTRSDPRFICDICWQARVSILLARGFGDAQRHLAKGS